MNSGEYSRIVERYRERDAHPPVDYDPSLPWVMRTVRERDFALQRAMHASGFGDYPSRRVLEIGCGAGGNLLFLLRLGFLPENLIGNDIVPERIDRARRRLPETVRLVTGSADRLALPHASVDMILQSLLFSSLLDADLRKRVSAAAWRILKPGGGLLWYDMRTDNPRNRNVRGISLSEIKRLFPAANITAWRVTLAPPISRAVCRVTPWLYEVFNLIPILRTHLICWIGKPGGSL